jgi:hypothetical protein
MKNGRKSILAFEIKSNGWNGKEMKHPHPDKRHVVDSCRRYILACGRKFTGREYGTARALIHYRDLLETYVTAKKELIYEK